MEISDRRCAMTLFTEYPIGKCAAEAVPRRRNKHRKSPRTHHGRGCPQAHCGRGCMRAHCGQGVPASALRAVIARGRIAGKGCTRTHYGHGFSMSTLPSSVARERIANRDCTRASESRAVLCSRTNRQPPAAQMRIPQNVKKKHRRSALRDSRVTRKEAETAKEQKNRELIQTKIRTHSPSRDSMRTSSNPPRIRRVFRRTAHRRFLSARRKSAISGMRPLSARPTIHSPRRAGNTSDKRNFPARKENFIPPILQLCRRRRSLSQRVCP